MSLDGRANAAAPGRGGEGANPGWDGRPIAAFDFDGTLTVRDSFTAFLRWRTNAAGWALGLVRLSPALLAYAVHRDRGRLKAASVRVFLRGLSREELDAQAEAFAAAVFDRTMRPDALARWAKHGADGDLRVIVTASPQETVAPFARRLGADALIGSRLAWTGDGCVGEGLDGPNCRGEEKVRRLGALLGADLRIGDAYGDTGGDLQMLAIAQRGHMRVFTGRPAGPPRP